MMRLYFKGSDLGNIENISVEGVWMNGEFRPSSEGKKMADFFAFVINKESNWEDLPFPEDLLDDKNWWVMEEDGRKRNIDMPAVHKMNYITWRWR